MTLMPFVLLRACAAAAVLTLAGCGTMSAVADGDGADAGAAYVYGRFELVGAMPIGSITSSFACEDGSSFAVAFKPGDDAVQVVKVSPGVCSLRGWIFTDGTGVKTRRAYVGTTPKKLRFEPGTMLYVGDFEVRMKIETLGTIAQKRWSVTDAKNAFDATTRSAQASLPGAKSLKAVNATATAVAAAPQAVR
jgi:hypothetical protein